MRIKLAFTMQDDNINRLINAIVEACNESSLTKPSFVVRKRLKSTGELIYSYSAAKEIMDFLNDGYEIVAVIKKDI